MLSFANRVSAGRLVVILAAFFVLGAVPAAAAPWQAVQLRIDSISWDGDAQEFVVELSLKQGLAKGGQQAGFSVSTVLLVDSGGTPIATVGPQSDPVVIASGAVPDADGFIALEPQRIAWDRNGGSFAGLADVSAASELQTAAGKPLGQPAAGGPVPDVTPLAGMTKMRSLSLFNNDVTDIGALTGMTEMVTLTLDFNQISDLSPLGGMGLLDRLTVSHNLVSDLSVLPGLASLSHVGLIANPIDCSDPVIGILEAGGVEVVSSCP